MLQIYSKWHVSHRGVENLLKEKTKFVNMKFLLCCSTKLTKTLNNTDFCNHCKSKLQKVELSFS